MKALGSCHMATITTDHSLDLGIDYMEGGKLENLEKLNIKAQEGPTCTLQLYSYQFQVENTVHYMYMYTQLVGHPSSVI